MTALAYIDRIRREHALLTIDDVLALADRGNTIFDPFSALISQRIVIGTGNVLYPGVTLLCAGDAVLEIGDANHIHNGTVIEATQGIVRIGSRNRFGEGGFVARANRPNAEILIGDDGRYNGGAVVVGRSTLGSGSQILGGVTAQDCVLAAGGSFEEPDPDKRAGLLKGTGTARGLTVPIGHVIAGFGTFSADDLLPQTAFHPKA